MDYSGSSKKSKKKKKEHKYLEDNDDILNEHSKNKKKSKKDVNQINKMETNYNEVPRTSEDQLVPPSISKEETNDDLWTKEELLELIRRMELQLPENDTISFNSRAEKLDWSQVQFGDHTIEDCKLKWKFIKGKVRRFRLLNEVLQDLKIWAETPWLTHTKKRKVRHPEEPARPLTSYMLFFLEKNEKIKKKHPDLKPSEISKLVGEKFNALSEEKKAPYVNKAKQIKDEYKENLTKFYEKYPELQKRNRQGTKKVKGDTGTKIKKPEPPFKHYLKDKFLKHQNDENFNQHEFMEKYKDAWKHLSSRKKAFWIRLAKDEEDKYLDLLHGLPENEDTTIAYKSVLSKEENNILDKLAGKPEKPPNSAYSLFSRLMLQSKDDCLVDGQPKNRMKEVGTKWKEMPEEQKKAYAEEAQHMQEIYKLEFANYLESLPEEKRAEELAKVQQKKRAPKSKQKVPNKVTESATTSLPRQDLYKNEPEKPPVTAWDLYKNEYFIKNSHLPSKVAFKKAAATWKTLSKKEVEKYKRKHDQLKEKYMVDFEMFIKGLNEVELKEYALKTSKSRERELNEESAEEESSSEEDDSTDESGSDESDSGVSEAD